MTKCRLVAYYRVSTDKQGVLGLGMDAQRTLVAAHVARTGCEVVATYTEVESGKGSGNLRPELVKALVNARKVKATLVIAKLDRLGRNVHFVSGLMESGVSFVAADSPDDEPFVLHMKAVFAEEEARKISERTKAALAALKARGVKLGTPRNLTQEGRVRGAAKSGKVAKAKADEAYSDITPLVKQLRSEGLTLQSIADRLNNDGHTTRRAKPWNQVQVMRVLERAT